MQKIDATIDDSSACYDGVVKSDRPISNEKIYLFVFFKTVQNDKTKYPFTSACVVLPDWVVD